MDVNIHLIAKCMLYSHSIGTIASSMTRINGCLCDSKDKMKQPVSLVLFFPVDPRSLPDDSLPVSLPTDIQQHSRNQCSSWNHRKWTTSIAHFAQRVLLVCAKWTCDNQNTRQSSGKNVEFNVILKMKLIMFLILILI